MTPGIMREIKPGMHFSSPTPVSLTEISEPTSYVLIFEVRLKPPWASPLILCSSSTLCSKVTRKQSQAKVMTPDGLEKEGKNNRFCHGVQTSFLQSDLFSFLSF